MEMVKEGEIQPKVPSNGIQLQEIVEKGEEDRVSALPDCLLLEILSRLPTTKDAIATGTFSKRWKHLWTLLPTLIFKHDHRYQQWFDFVSFVDKTLTQCRQLKLKKFVVCTCYPTGFDLNVNNWIRFLISRGVEELKLNFWYRGCGAFVLLDQSFFISSCFTDLTLQGCILNPVGEISWKNLSNLCITSAKLNENLIENILSGSPVLETLNLNKCYGYRRLNITSKRIKNLVFSGYMDPDEAFVAGAFVFDEADECDECFIEVTKMVEINAPNILSLTVRGSLLLRKLLLLNVSCLVEAKLNYKKLGFCKTSRKEAEDEMLEGLILNLRHVKELKIGGFCDNVVSRLEAKGFDFPSNTKFPGDTYDWCESEIETEYGDTDDGDDGDDDDDDDSDDGDDDDDDDDDGDDDDDDDDDGDSVESGDWNYGLD